MRTMERDDRSTARDLALSLNRETDRILENTSPTEWDENHISFQLVRSLRDSLEQTGEVRSHKDDSPTFIKAEAYKISGEIEQEHGDIAIVVNYAERGVTGLGFYEAKREDGTGRYPAFKKRQLQRLMSATPRLSVLFYEQSPRSVIDDDYAPLNFEDIYAYYRGEMHFRRSASSRVRVLGANLLSRYSEPPSQVMQFAQTFGHHFVTRYLSGRDLDYSREPAAALEKWLKGTKRTPPLIVGVSLAPRPSALSHQLEQSLSGFQYEPVPIGAAAALPPSPKHLGDGES